jgi:FAD-linked oxidoreductase
VYSTPGSEEELAQIVGEASGEVRVTGAGHSFSELVPTEAALIDVSRLAGVERVNEPLRQAICGAGTKIRDLGEPLGSRGLALENQGDVDAQTIAGACATGTHGTGVEFGCLATTLVGFRLVTAGGEILECDSQQNADVFAAGRVSLGMLGVMSQVTLQCRSAYYLKEEVRTLDLEECFERADELARSNRHFEFFHFPYADRALVKTLNECPQGAFGATSDRREDSLFAMACRIGEWLPGMNPVLQRVVMRWYGGRARCGPSYNVFPSARTVRFNEIEYEVPADSGVACFREIIAAVRKARLLALFPIEFRRIKADDIWLSPFYGRDSVAISVHQIAHRPHAELFGLVEPIFWKYDGRPHWGKMHSLGHEQLARLYPCWREFMELRRAMDPRGKFLNRHLRSLIGEGA